MKRLIAVLALSAAATLAACTPSDSGSSPNDGLESPSLTSPAPLESPSLESPSLESPAGLESPSPSAS
jgi:hypothetical protein